MQHYLNQQLLLQLFPCKSKSSTSSDVLSEILALPSVPPQQKHRNAMNNKAVCVTDMLDDLKLQEAKKMDEKALAKKRGKRKKG